MKSGAQKGRLGNLVFAPQFAPYPEPQRGRLSRSFDAAADVSGAPTGRDTLAQGNALG